MRNEKEIRSLLDQYNLSIKVMGNPPPVLGEASPENEDKSMLSGMTWDKRKDLVAPNWQLILTNKIKGLPTGDD